MWLCSGWGRCAWASMSNTRLPPRASAVLILLTSAAKLLLRERRPTLPPLFMPPCAHVRNLQTGPASIRESAMFQGYDWCIQP